MTTWVVTSMPTCAMSGVIRGQSGVIRGNQVVDHVGRHVDAHLVKQRDWTDRVPEVEHGLIELDGVAALLHDSEGLGRHRPNATVDVEA